MFLAVWFREVFEGSFHPKICTFVCPLFSIMLLLTFIKIIQSPSEARGLGNENGRSRSDSVSAAQGFWRRGRRRGRGPRGERGAEGLDRGSAAA